MTKPQISEAAYGKLASWKATKPVATLMGEFSAGKSTLLNFILGLDAAPTQVTATHMPPTWFSYSDTPFTLGVTWDGQEEQIDLNAADTDFRADYLVIRRGLASDALKGCDVIDAPGISDPGLQKDALRFLSRYTDFVVWCTAANQAWRQTENAAYRKLSNRIKSNSLLVITRMDKLRTANDQAKVMKRVTADAGPHFQHVLPLQTPKAAAVEEMDRGDAPDCAWVLTGGHGFMSAFHDTCATIEPKAMSPKKAAKQKAAKTPKIKKKTAAGSEAPVNSGNVAAKLVATMQNLKTKPENGQYFSKIDHLIAAIPCELGEAKPANGTLLECARIDPDDFDIQRLISQVGREIAVFGKCDRFRLDARSI